MTPALACADEADAPRQDEAKARPRMEAMPPARARRERRPFDDAPDDAEAGAREEDADRRRDPAGGLPMPGTSRLGASVAPVPDAVREQLDLPVGVGLLIDGVAAESPAATGGLKRFDVLTRFNDQIVCNADQLGTLIAIRKPGPVALTILRGGRERKVPVVLPAAQARDRAEVDDRPDPPRREGLGIPPGALPGALQQQAEELARQMQQQALGLGGGPGRSRTTRMTVSPQGKERIDTESDGTTTIEIRQSAGKFSVDIRRADGERLHAGPLDTDADRRRVPEKFRQRVERLIEEVGVEHR